MPNAAIFLSHCLPLSSVFVLHQMQAMQRYKPHVLACKRVEPSVDLGAIPAAVINRHHTPIDRALEFGFKLTGYAPSLSNVAKHCDIMHAHFGPTGLLALPLARKANIPLVVTLHGFDVLKRNPTLQTDGRLFMHYVKHLQTLAQGATQFICVSDYTKQRAIEFGFPEEKCTVHYMGIPLIEHTVPKAERSSEQPFRIITVGRHVPFKGHAKLIEALSAVEKEGHHIHVDFVGDGELRGELEQQAEQSLSSYTFHGAKQHADVIRLMRGADLFCHTSMHQPNGQTEAFGLVVLEAQWAGLPVVAFASGGVPEAVKEGETALLCPEGDVQALKEAVCNMLSDDAKRISMASASPNFVKDHFDNRLQTQKLEEIYDQIRNQ